MENFVGSERVMEFLGYTNPESVYRRVAEGLPCVRLRGQLRFRLSEVERWLAEQDGSGQAAVVPINSRRTA